MTTPNGGGSGPAPDTTNPEGQAPDGQQAEGQEPAATPDPNAEPETFDRAYVERLRREAAEHRVKRQEAEQQVQQFQQANMTEAQRLQAERDAAVARVEALETENRRNALQAAVTAEATALGFHSPTVALRLLDESAVVDADGKPANVRKALSDLLKDNPYLAKRSTADAGDGRKPASTSSMNGLIRQAAGR